MKCDKNVIFVISTMKGGGAERVMSILANRFYEEGIGVKVILTSATPEEIINTDLNESVPIICLNSRNSTKNICRIILRLFSSLICKSVELFGFAVPSKFAYWSFLSEYKDAIDLLKEEIKHQKDAAIISFLQPAIPITLLAASKLQNRLIISERGDPIRLMKKRYGENFIKKYYGRADCAVFQTTDAQRVYPSNVGSKGVVIPNPIKENLPLPYFGKRNKNITTFCRISAQKNLPLLLEAFNLLHKEHPEYKLRIIGNSFNDEGEAVKACLDNRIDELDLADSVVFEPFKDDIHNAIIEDAMYVNSSDYEGISNAMLEAMAIGMPVVCTDCPIGGANATIKDGENGLLVPIKNAEALCEAMKRVIEDEQLASKLSYKAAKLRESLSVKNIAEEWIKLL